jgi:hypothetical protein
LVVREWAVKKDVLYNFGNCPAGTGDTFFCCRWEVLVFELEAVRSDEWMSCDASEACQRGLYFTGNVTVVGIYLAALALNPDPC